MPSEGGGGGGGGGGGDLHVEPWTTGTKSKSLPATDQSGNIWSILDILYSHDIKTPQIQGSSGPLIFAPKVLLDSL